jgi:hypothetical protein
MFDSWQMKEAWDALEKVIQNCYIRRKYNKIGCIYDEMKLIGKLLITKNLATIPHLTTSTMQIF